MNDTLAEMGLQAGGEREGKLMLGNFQSDGMLFARGSSNLIEDLNKTRRDGRSRRPARPLSTTEEKDERPMRRKLQAQCQKKKKCDDANKSSKEANTWERAIIPGSCPGKMAWSRNRKRMDAVPGKERNDSTDTFLIKVRGEGGQLKKTQGKRSRQDASSARSSRSCGDRCRTRRAVEVTGAAAGTDDGNAAAAAAAARATYPPRRHA
jgi:hypothetical protein